MGKQQQTKRRRHQQPKKKQHDWMKAARRKARHQAMYKEEIAVTLHAAKTPKAVMKRNQSHQAEISRLHTTIIDLNQELALTLDQKWKTEKQILSQHQRINHLQVVNAELQMKMLDQKAQLENDKRKQHRRTARSALIGWTCGTLGALVGWLLIQLGHSL